MTGRIVAGALAVVVAIVAVIVATGGSDPYKLKLELANTSGLKDGSPVVISGVDRGKVKLHLRKDDTIEAELQIDRKVAPIGRDVRVAITAANFLGQKRVEILQNDKAEPAPSGYVVPAAQVTTPTDLDQVLNVLDADTRTRATILLNELGTAVLGRRADINQLLREFPPGFVDATAVLRQLTSDNHSLADLVAHSDRFVAQATAQRRNLVRMVDVLGQTAQTVAAKRAALRSTLRNAPATLRSLQGFLADLETTARPLTPAAKEIAAASPALASTLAEVRPFTQAAKPTLSQARTVAPQLTQLGDRATPVLRKALPTMTSLATLAHALPPVTKTLDNSADNIIAILENWSRAIQFRDGLGHVFRGEAGYSTDLLTTMMDRLVAPAERKSAAKKAKAPAVVAPDVKKRLDDVKKPLRKTIEALPKAVQKVVDDVLGKTKDALGQTVGGLTGALSGGGKTDSGDKGSTSGLLDYLLRP